MTVSIAAVRGGTNDRPTRLLRDSIERHRLPLVGQGDASHGLAGVVGDPGEDVAVKRSPLKRGKRITPVSAKGRARWDTLKALRIAVIARAEGRCQYCGAWGHLDAHHVVKRSQGGTDTMDNLVALCRSCHDRTDSPYAKGKLHITALGRGCFRMILIYTTDVRGGR